ncbi:hypothetical protein BJX99DRAFT_253188 [Aspergillus californicus]
MATLTLLPNPLFIPARAWELEYASEASNFPPARPGSPAGASTRSIRSNRSSTDSDPEFDGMIEEDLRAGGPRLCQPPCETTDSTPDTSPWRALRKHADRHATKIHALAAKSGDHVEGVRFCGRRSEFSNAAYKPTVLLYITRHDPQARGWIQIARQVLSYVVNTIGVTGVTVELVDPRFDEPLRIFSCLRTDAIYPVWNQLGPRIVRNINLAGVSSVGCFRVGSSAERMGCPVTVLVGVDYGVQGDWRTTRQRIVRMLDTEGLKSVAVLIRCDGRLVNAVDDTPTSSEAAQKAIDDMVKPGASLSPHKGQKGSATFGGWIQVQSPATKDYIDMGITCTHCVFPEDAALSGNDLTNARNWKEHGIAANDIKAKELLIIDVPSKGRLQNTIKSTASDIDLIKSLAQYKELEKIRNSDDSFMRPGQVRQMEKLDKSITANEGKRRALEEALDEKKYVFGRVFAASGLKQKELLTTSLNRPSGLGSSMDWALIRPQGARAPTNKVPPYKDIPYTHLREFSIDQIEPGETLFKVGASTDLTRAEYGGLIECLIGTEIVDGVATYVKTWEHVFVAGDAKTTVVQPGDSGALVFNKDYQVVGLLFGGHEKKLVDRGYFIHAKNLIKDIKEATGATDVIIGEYADADDEDWI